MENSLLYVTAKNQAEAKKIATALLNKKLIACANILPKTLSLYDFQGKRREEAEAIIFMKTRRENVPVVTETVKTIHSYECPCVVSVPIEDGNEDYFDWIVKQTLKLSKTARDSA